MPVAPSVALPVHSGYKNLSLDRELPELEELILKECTVKARTRYLGRRKEREKRQPMRPQSSQHAGMLSWGLSDSCGRGMAFNGSGSEPIVPGSKGTSHPLPSPSFFLLPRAPQVKLRCMVKSNCTFNELEDALLQFKPHHVVLSGHGDTGCLFFPSNGLAPSLPPFPAL